MPSILLTGGTGFFGKAILNYLDAQPALTTTLKVTVLSRHPQSFLSQHPEFQQRPWLNFVAADVLQPLDAVEAVDWIIHAAADSSTQHMPTPLERYLQIVEGTRNVLDYAIRCNSQKLLYVSSGAVYGQLAHHSDPIPESMMGYLDPLSSANAYANAKRAAEQLCMLYASQSTLEVVVARCFAFVGPDLPHHIHFAIGNFIHDALTQDQIVVKGDGSPLRSYLYQEDLARWLLTLLEKGQHGQAYNIGSDQAISIRSLATLVRDLIAPEKTVHVMGLANASGNRIDQYVPNIDKVKTTLGLDMVFDLKQSILRTADAYLKQRQSNTLNRSAHEQASRI